MPPAQECFEARHRSGAQVDTRLVFDLKFVVLQRCSEIDFQFLAGDQPFFVYLAHHAVHTPIEAKTNDIQHFDAKLRDGMQHRHGIYAAMTKNLDDNIGRILDHLKQRGLDRNTVVLFASDNGGYIGLDKASGRTVPVTSNSPLRSGKGALYEGGIRVPLAVRWPGVIKPGSICHVLKMNQSKWDGN